MWLLIAFIAVPLIEIGLFIQVGDAIGLWPTLGIVLLTAILGTALVKSQGAMALMNVRRSLTELSDPTEPLANGAMILFAGALLLTPGFFTDAVGFALLLPGVRSVIYKKIRERVNIAQFHQSQAGPHSNAKDDVVDGTFEDVEMPKKPNKGPSGWTQ
jgi:UPF0716 protein FxsA